ncbi:MAG TPA: STAS domain-containing protein [Bryobacteraceae bacterium]|nr:STAS domain-containing protein [Bryobacteraceae bacterium]
MLLEIQQHEVKPGVMVVKLTGSVMRGPESQQLEVLVPALLAQGYRTIVFDLSEVKRIDSTGIGRFIFSLNAVDQAGGQMRMAGATGYVRDCFRVTRLDTVFQFSPTIEQACAE